MTNKDSVPRSIQTPAEIRLYILDALQIPYTNDWQGLTTGQVLDRLREALAWRLEDLANVLVKSEQAARQAANSGNPRAAAMTRQNARKLMVSNSSSSVTRVVTAFKPRLKKLTEEGWLNPKSLEFNDARYDEVGQACRNLREWAESEEPTQTEPRADWSDRELKRRLEGEKMNVFDVMRLETSPREFSPADLMSITERLCTLHHITLQEFLACADAASFKTPARSTSMERKEIGRTAGAISEFLGLEQKDWVKAGFFSHTPQVSNFFAGELYVSAARIHTLPGVIANAYRDAFGTFPPEEARCKTIDELRQKGGRLAQLDKVLLRTAIRTLLDTRERKNALPLIARACGFSEPAVLKWLNQPDERLREKTGPRGFMTYHIRKMGEALGVADIFKLEAIGKTALKDNYAPSGWHVKQVQELRGKRVDTERGI